ncbi:DUF4377 domain-containing protein [Aquimarina muelleri]|uniref:DUF4377 domain-containing protein n=1 Tax=Aquimarina muelleri TaxID=279356 RepID=A0A918JWL1_9FLAO|nr:DUF4377 domain-containing protein [Aquimarina muelleri]MCX2763220.1 DUF4377 domain-containing protein [Aquimarina muelleri]GGX20034.1 hypothetical protein GCM10007384_21780 [Aquimarina muelleri]
MNNFVVLVSFIFLFSSCKETKTIFIAGSLADCVGEAPQKCILYKENPTEDWLFFYDTIEGFKYEEGYIYEIEVAITKIENPPADGSSLQYTLVKILSKEKDLSITPNFPDTVIHIEYESLSRASFLQIKINKDLIERTTDRNLKKFSSKECSKEDWKSILSLLKNIDFKKIDILKSPTEKRLFDGAPHAQLKITISSQTYTSSGFDHGNPPQEIEPLITAILGLAESIENNN